ARRARIQKSPLAQIHGAPAQARGVATALRALSLPRVESAPRGSRDPRRAGGPLCARVDAAQPGILADRAPIGFQGEMRPLRRALRPGLTPIRNSRWPPGLTSRLRANN